MCRCSGERSPLETEVWGSFIDDILGSSRERIKIRKEGACSTKLWNTPMLSLSIKGGKSKGDGEVGGERRAGEGAVPEAKEGRVSRGQKR